MCLCVYATHVQGSLEVRRGSQMSCSWSYMWFSNGQHECQELNFGPLEEQHGLNH